MSEPTKLRTRIGTNGLPTEVWQVYTVGVGVRLAAVGFYDRDKAVAYAAAGPNRHMKAIPMQIQDAS